MSGWRCRGCRGGAVPGHLTLTLWHVSYISVKRGGGGFVKQPMGPLLASPSPPVRQAARSQDRSLVSGALLCASGHQGTEQNGAVPKDITVHPVLMDRGGRDHVIRIDKSSEGRKIDFFSSSKRRLFHEMSRTRRRPDRSDVPLITYKSL